MKEVLNASVEEIKKVPGISETLALEIYDKLHGLQIFILFYSEITANVSANETLASKTRFYFAKSIF